MTLILTVRYWACGETLGKYNGNETNILLKQWTLDQTETIPQEKVSLNYSSLIAHLIPSSTTAPFKSSVFVRHASHNLQLHCFSGMGALFVLLSSRPTQCNTSDTPGDFIHRSRLDFRWRLMRTHLAIFFDDRGDVEVLKTHVIKSPNLMGWLH